MAHCSNCGAQAAPQAKVCTECGTKIEATARLGTQTIVGGVSPLFDQTHSAPEVVKVASHTETGPNASRGKAFSGTMIGIPSPVRASKLGASPPSPPQPTMSVPQRPFSGTMVGMPTPAAVLEARAAAQALANAQKDCSTAGEQAPSEQQLPLGSTQSLGSRTPDIPKQASSAGEASRPPAIEERRFAGTLLGVAQPGIAPVHPPAQAPPAPITPEEKSDGHPLPPPSESLPGNRHSFGLPRPSRPLWQTTSFIVTGVLAAAGIGAVVAQMGRPDVTIQVTRFAVDDAGKDQLVLLCEECPDRTRLEIGAARSEFKDKTSTLIMERPLSLGQNEFRPRITGPEGKSLSSAPLIVPVAFRMSSNWTGRHETPPFGQVLVEAPAGSTIKIDGKEAKVEAGRAEHTVAIDQETLGEATEVEKIALEIPIEVRTDGKVRTTRASLRSGITPLRLTSIGPVHRLHGGPVTIAGVTMPNETVKFATHSARANESGQFAIQLESPEEITGFVEAGAKDLLSRRVPLALKKSVEPIEVKIGSLATLAEPGFVKIKGEVVESRVSEGVTRFVLEVGDGCSTPPCLVSATYAEPLKLKANKHMDVYGWAMPGTGESTTSLHVIEFQ